MEREGAGPGAWWEPSSYWSVGFLFFLVVVNLDPVVKSVLEVVRTSSTSACTPIRPPDSREKSMHPPPRIQHAVF